MFEYIKIGLVYIFDFFNSPDFIKGFYRRHLYYSQLGCSGNAAANGDFLSAVCLNRGLWLFAENCI